MFKYVQFMFTKHFTTFYYVHIELNIKINLI